MGQSAHLCKGENVGMGPALEFVTSFDPQIWLAPEKQTGCSP